MNFSLFCNCNFLEMFSENSAECRLITRAKEIFAKSTKSYCRVELQSNTIKLVEYVSGKGAIAVVDKFDSREIDLQKLKIWLEHERIGYSGF